MNLDTLADVAALNASPVKQTILLSIVSFDPYYSCPVPRCNGVKLQSLEVPGEDNRLQLVCPVYKGPIIPNTANQSIVARFVASTTPW